ncbi:MAG TPA: TetR family transcriptional regulator, partial [Novosphingobium sp.]|nr:TetR family transcriptional regulator [Novosphingobium sp.]
MNLATPPPRRTQAQRREESENRLLAAAAEIIAGEGYLACTLERVGERAGFSRGLAGRKYGSKDGLIEAVIWRVSAQVHAEVDAAIAGLASPLEQLLALFDRFVELALRDTSVRAYFVLFSAMIANRLETRTVFEEVQQRFGQRIEDLVIAGQAS